MASRGLAVLWFTLSSVVCFYDALFVFLRPRTLPGGDLHHIWKPYGLYITVDTPYGDMENEFTIAQSWLNLGEIVLNVVTIALLLRHSKAARLVGFAVSLMTFWKTFLYLVQYTQLCGVTLAAHLSWQNYILLLMIPSGIWIVMPLCFVLSYGAEILAILQNHKAKRS